MAIVSISEAARLIGKSRATVHRNIEAGKLSRTPDGKGIDTSELMRVFGDFKGKSEHVPVHVEKNEMLQRETHQGVLGHEHVQAGLQAEILHLKELLKSNEKLLEAKDKHIESLDNAMRLLEDQRQKTPPAAPEEPKKEEPKGFFKRLFNI